MASLWDMQNAIRDARGTLDAADSVTERLAELLQGRLRQVSAYELRKMKRELQGFNARTGKWKS